MTYRIAGLDPARFETLRNETDAALAEVQAVRVVADAKPGFPCRITLEDAEPGESLLLLQHISHDVATPFRSSYAIYVRERARMAAVFEDCVPDALANRTIALRAFDSGSMLHKAELALPGELDGAIRSLFDDEAVAYIHAHYAAPGCFAAAIERHEGDHA